MLPYQVFRRAKGQTPSNPDREWREAIHRKHALGEFSNYGPDLSVERNEFISHDSKSRMLACTLLDDRWPAT